MSAFTAQSVNHLNPCKQKITYPILKQSTHDFKSQMVPKLDVDMNVNMNINVKGQILRRKASCPQIIKIRNKISSPTYTKDEDSTKNKKNRKYINIQGNSNRNCHEDDHDIENISSYYLSKDELKLLNHLTHKNSVQTIVSYQQNDSSLTVTPRPNFYSKRCLNQHLHNEMIEKLFQQNIQLTKQLQKKQKKIEQKQNEYNKLEQQYIRFLQISNQRSQSKIKILLQQSQSRLNKSKIKNSAISERASQIKSKLEVLDISTIKSTKCDRKQKKNANSQKQNTHYNHFGGESQKNIYLDHQDMDNDKQSFIKLSEIM